MNLKFASASATAIGLLLVSGAAYAGDGNNALINQNGLTNSATTNQGGAFNSTIGNVGTSLFVKQTDNNNVLWINQAGGNNAIGTVALTGSFAAANAGVLQQNSLNYLEIHQGEPYPNDTNANLVGSVVQYTNLASGVTATPSSGYSNSAVIRQGWHDSIGFIGQRYDGSTTPGNAVAVTQDGGNNIDSITQTQLNGFARNNSISVSMANPTYNGDLNGKSSGLLNGLNSAAAAGVSTWSGITATSTLGGGNILLTPIPQSTILQKGANDLLNASISGYGNLFGFQQFGNLNSVSATVTAGIDTQLAIRQNGDSNAAGVQMSGAGNDLGIAQFNAANVANGYISGSGNSAGILQNGLGGINNGTAQTGASTANNIIEVVQSANGGGNTGSVTVSGTGTNNYEMLVQNNSGGATNVASITISGNNNNKLSSFGAGTAALAEATAEGLNSTSTTLNLGAAGNYLNSLPRLTPGISVQSGDNNHLTANVLSSNNLFATSQLGTSNVISSTIMGGNGNSLAIFQSSVTSGNSATTLQNGANNSIGLSQVGVNTANLTQ